jgi:DNA helicase-2/ATP-dependent DNA helicase PcrA
MEYEITPQRQAYLDARGYTILNACPGSGKTTSIVKKLFAVSRYCEDQYGHHTGFVCLSFTNTACDELKLKYREMHGERITFPNEVLTIDSFITQYVVLPFWYLCDICKKRPVIVNENEALERIYYNNVLIDGEWKQFLAAGLGLYGTIIHKKTPSCIARNMNSYEWNNHLVADPFELEYCEKAFAYRMGKGFITSRDALWMACDILKKHQNIAKALVSRFPYVIVDEAQDNSELHFEFFKQLKRAGLRNLEFVGDICQSIYGFNNAKPELLQSLMQEEGWGNLPMTECRRSNQRIIDLYSKLKSNDVQSITSYGVEDKGIPIVVYKYNDTNIQEIFRDFYNVCLDNDLSSSKVLARGEYMCKKLAGVNESNFKYWKTDQIIPYLLIDAVLAFSSGKMDIAFRKVRLALAELKYSNSIELKREFIDSIEKDINVNTRIFGFLKKVPPFSLSFKDWSEQTCKILQTFWQLESEPVFVPFKKKKYGDLTMKDIADMPIENYYQSCDVSSEYFKRINTIHSVKGETLDAVLLFLSPDSRGECISLNDFPSTVIRTMTEKQRLIYVACSRATQFLALAVPAQVADSDIRDALDGIEVDIRAFNIEGVLAFK